MPQIQVEEDDDVILVEFTPAPGVRSVSLTPTDIAEKSKEAIDHAMKIHAPHGEEDHESHS